MACAPMLSDHTLLRCASSESTRAGIVAPLLHKHIADPAPVSKVTTSIHCQNRNSKSSSKNSGTGLLRYSIVLRPHLNSGPQCLTQNVPPASAPTTATGVWFLRSVCETGKTRLLIKRKRSCGASCPLNEAENVGKSADKLIGRNISLRGMMARTRIGGIILVEPWR